MIAAVAFSILNVVIWIVAAGIFVPSDGERGLWLIPIMLIVNWFACYFVGRELFDEGGKGLLAGFFLGPVAFVGMWVIHALFYAVDRTSPHTPSSARAAAGQSAGGSSPEIECPWCKGTGSEPGAVASTGMPVKCTVCHGSGRVSQDRLRQRPGFDPLSELAEAQRRELAHELYEASVLRNKDTPFELPRE